MSVTETSQPDLLVAGDRIVHPSRDCPAMTMTCLLVSCSQEHTNILERAATEEGWSLDACGTVLEAMKAVFLKRYELALVDMQSVTGTPLKPDYQQLACDLSRNHVPLLVVNGDPSDPLSEISARQLGVWIYLPGFDGKTEPDLLFREAQLAHEKLAKSPLEAVVEPASSNSSQS